MLRIKRIYDKALKRDGERILVDRLWPRGISKDEARLDQWVKNIAPSTELRIWFDHKPERFEEFSKRYIDELLRNPSVKALKQHIALSPNVTLLYAAKDPTINHVVILKKFLEN